MSRKPKVPTTAQFSTLAIRAARSFTAEQEHSEPIFLTSSFIFDSAEQAAARFANEEPGNIYTRFTNPTVRALEQRIALLEGGERAVATASGMAAIMSACVSLLQAGDHIVSSRAIFGTISILFEKYLTRLGLQITFVALQDLKAWEKAIQKNTKLLFLETPSNPLSEVGDIAALAQLAHRHKALLMVDNCFCTPALQKPLQLGADLVVHSATKYIDGQGRCLGGVVVGSQSLMEEVHGFVRTAGPTMSPFNAWVFLKGLETLGLRMQAHSASALALAQWLQQQPQVEKVYYSGLPDHPQYALAKKQQQAFSGVLSFEVKGNKATAWKFINSTQWISITANLGDSKTTITHPATTTHGRLSPEEKLAAGIKDNLIRISVGLEAVEDIKQDLQKGFASL